MTISKDFIDGIRFAMAVIEDSTARRNCCVGYRETKKHREEREIRNYNSKDILFHLNYLLRDDETLTPWVEEYQANKLWNYKEFNYEVES